jgi:hypothetical protein
MQRIAVLLKVSLPLFEKVLFGRFGLLFPEHVVAVSVGPLQHSAALHNREACIPQKLQLLGWVLLDAMQKLDFFLDFRQQVFRVFLRFAVIVVAFVVEHIALQLMLRVFNLLCLLLERIGVLQLIKLIAFVITSTCRPVLLP